MDREKNSTWVSGTLFILILACISLFYGYHRIVKYPPQSIHAWRQSDCASITLNYYKNGMKFFHPEIHNLIADGGTTGFVATSEVPVYYYFIAGLYKVFGPHDFLMRLINIIIFITGLFYLYRFFLLVLKDQFWSVSLSLLLFTSPVLVYYACNYLTNITAFSFSIVGCYYFYGFYLEKTNRSLYLSALMFLLAGSFKITGLFSVAVIGLFFLVDLFKRGPLEKFRTGVFDKPLRQIIPFIALLSIIAGWILYAHRYNMQHDTTYFSTSIYPLWDYDSGQIMKTLREAIILWLSDYFSVPVLILLGGLSVSIIINYRYIHHFFLRFTILLIPVLMLYAILQFYFFAAHDYYTINMYILPVFILLTSMQGWMKRAPKLTASLPLKLAFLIFLAWNIYYCSRRIDLRYEGWRNATSEMLVYGEIRDRLPGMGLEETDTVIAIAGRSPHALYLLDRKGWTEYFGETSRKGPHISLNLDSAGIQSSIAKGARYLFIRGENDILVKPWLIPYATHLAGRYGDLLVFDLLSGEINFNINDPRVVREIICDAEELSYDGTSFRSSNDTVLLEFGDTRSGEEAWSGQHSAKLSPLKDFSMTLTLSGIKWGEEYVASAWMKGDAESCSITASGEDPDMFYQAFNVMEVADSAGWSNRSLHFTIPKILDGKAVRVYLYYTGMDSVYCDDMRIRQYDHMPVSLK